MTRFIIILIIGALTSQFLVKVGIVGYYLVNKDYIAKVLCINKDKPEMGCNGKCHLRKQLQKQEESEKKLPSCIKQMEETTLMVNGEFEPIKKIYNLSYTLKYLPFIQQIAQGTISSIFHPPNLIFQNIIQH